MMEKRFASGGLPTIEGLHTKINQCISTWRAQWFHWCIGCGAEGFKTERSMIHFIYWIIIIIWLSGEHGQKGMITDYYWLIDWLNFITKYIWVPNVSKIDNSKIDHWDDHCGIECWYCMAPSRVFAEVNLREVYKVAHHARFSRFSILLLRISLHEVLGAPFDDHQFWWLHSCVWMLRSNHVERPVFRRVQLFC